MCFAGWHCSGHGDSKGYFFGYSLLYPCVYSYGGRGAGLVCHVWSHTRGGGVGYHAGYNIGSGRGCSSRIADGWQHTFTDRELFIGLIAEPAPQYGFGEESDPVLIGV
jgi:hypothetical protein